MNTDPGLFDDFLPDVTGDGKADYLDAFLINEMINDIEDQRAIKEAQKRKCRKSRK